MLPPPGLIGLYGLLPEIKNTLRIKQQAELVRVELPEPVCQLMWQKASDVHVSGNLAALPDNTIDRI